MTGVEMRMKRLFGNNDRRSKSKSKSKSKIKSKSKTMIKIQDYDLMLLPRESSGDRDRREAVKNQ